MQPESLLAERDDQIALTGFNVRLPKSPLVRLHAREADDAWNYRLKLLRLEVLLSAVV